MKKKIKTIIKILILTLFGISLICAFFRACEVLSPNKIKINQDVFLVHKNQSFSIYCSQASSGIYITSYQKLVATKVDSIIISYKYGTIFHGYNPSENKAEWFYVNVSKNIYDDFNDIEHITSHTMGNTYIDSALTAEEVNKLI